MHTTYIVEWSQHTQKKLLNTIIWITLNVKWAVGRISIVHMNHFNHIFCFFARLFGSIQFLIRFMQSSKSEKFKTFCIHITLRKCYLFVIMWSDKMILYIVHFYMQRACNCFHIIKLFLLFCLKMRIGKNVHVSAFEKRALIFHDTHVIKSI